MVAGKIEMNRPPRPQPGRPLRISYLFSQFPVPTEAFAVSDINALRRAGHRVTIHTMKPPPKNEAALRQLCGVDPDLAVLRPDFRRAGRWPMLLWRSRKHWAALARYIISAAPRAPATALSAALCIPRLLEIVEEVDARQSDVVHAFWSRHAGLVLALLEALNKPAMRSAFVGAYDLVADDFIVDKTLGSAQAIFTHAEANRAYAEAKALPGTRVHVVHRGIPLGDVRDKTSRDTRHWITASALVPEKNVEGVIRAFAAGRSMEPRLRLSIFGDGPDKRRLMSVAEQWGCMDAVAFKGHVPRAELFEELRRAGAFLLLSKKASERLPNVVKEALWAGCAVISSRSEGIEELIPDTSIGWVVDADDEPAVAGAVGAVLAQTDREAERRRAAARAVIEQWFSTDRNMQHYVDAWRSAPKASSVSQRVHENPVARELAKCP